MMTPDAESMMQRFKLQPDLFADKLSRLKLLGCNIAPDHASLTTVNVWRNHAFEPIISLVKPFFSYAGMAMDFRLSDYDDSLMFSARKPADIELLWLDSSRYLEQTSFPEWLAWLQDRLQTLRADSIAPIIIATWIPAGIDSREITKLVDSLSEVYFADIGRLCADADATLLDRRTEKVAGTALSSSAQLLIARTLACHWFAAAILPPIKAIALDLDNTLHSGVLGEEGFDRVLLTDGHLKLQSFIKSLHDRGVFLALVSRNEAADVRELFTKRSDYPLGLDDFSVTEISWGDKASAIQRIAESLLIGTDSILFVDDNPGELAAVKSQIPDIHSIHASQTANQTKRAIEYYPGLWRWKIEIDDSKRIADLRASNQRQLQLATSPDPRDYFRSLEVKLIIRVNKPEHMGRLADLCGKTNQFNLALRRFSQTELMKKKENKNGCVVGVQLKDRLSDSGIVAVIVAERAGLQLKIEEICISCRALGRQLEDIMILETIRSMPVFAEVTEVLFQMSRGPRNGPAIEWLSGTVRAQNKQDPLQPGWHKVPADIISGFKPNRDVSITREL
ncbi:MAG: HAD-IIIC family phosphatase [Gammaproteobacteria bacterium]|nr:HAD-IIIC family phosphatase [Gammaproteobacteria bacterium]